jgi:hypothetical protein
MVSQISLSSSTTKTFAMSYSFDAFGNQEVYQDLQDSGNALTEKITDS